LIDNIVLVDNDFKLLNIVVDVAFKFDICVVCPLIDRLDGRPADLLTNQTV
jgi:hypothetical protein